MIPEQTLTHLLLSMEKRLEKRLDFLIKLWLVQGFVIAIVLCWLTSIESRLKKEDHEAVRIEQSITNDSKQEKSFNYVVKNKRSTNGVDLEGVNGNRIK